MKEQELEDIRSRISRGKLRFSAEGYSENTIKESGSRTAGNMYTNLPSNYPDTLLSNTGALYRVFGEEFERLHKSLSDIAEDKFYEGTRDENLYQVLGSLLMLGSNAVGSTGPDGVSTLSGREYRTFLLKVRDAVLGGSRLANLEKSLQGILGVTVVIKELFAEAKKPNSPYGLKDTHRLLCDIDMDTPSTENSVGKLLQDIKFYLDIIRPAHSLLETRLVWTDSFNLAGTCSNPLEFGVNKNGYKVRFVYESTPSRFFSLTTLTKNMEATGASWEQGIIAALDTTDDQALRSIVLESGDTLVVSSASTFYASDSQGEFRIDASDLVVGEAVKFIGALAPGAMQFYETPKAVLANPLAIYNPDFTNLPALYEYAEKEMEVIDGQGRFEKLAADTLDFDGQLVMENPLCPGSATDRKVADVLTPMYEDMRDSCDYPSTSLTHYEAVATEGQFLFTLNPHPVLNAQGDLADVGDVQVYVNGRAIPDALDLLMNMTGEAHLAADLHQGDVVRFVYSYSGRFPGKVSFTKSYTEDDRVPDVKRLLWPYPSKLLDKGTIYSLQMNKFPLLDVMGNLATASDLTVSVDGVIVSNAVSSLRPLLGHVELSFLPEIGSTVTVDYSFTDKNRTYPAAVDDPSYTYDAFLGHGHNYLLLFDQPTANDHLAPVGNNVKIMTKGYRYRAFNLTGSSVLNSMDTLTTKESGKVSTASSFGLIGQSALIFSPEYLKDTAKYVYLDDMYLRNGLSPETVLHKGTPTFQRSFTDRGARVPGSDESGLVSHAKISDFRTQHKLALYSDLVEVVTSSGTDVPLSSICDSKDLSIATKFQEEYYPNRELRLNDYKDFANMLDPTSRPGRFKAIKGSDILRAYEGYWDGVLVGNALLVGEDSYTVIKVINRDTVQIHVPFSSASGAYGYVVVTPQGSIDHVRLNEVARRVVAKVPSLFPYSDSYKQASTGFTPWIIRSNFPDPGEGPAPRNPGNPLYPVPSDPLLLSDVHSDSGETDLLLSPEEADKMVKFRNWDQGLFITGLGLVTEPLSPMDDLGDALVVRYWNVAGQTVVPRAFTGTVIMLSEGGETVPAGAFPNAVINLRSDPDAIGSNESSYLHYTTIVRELREDGLVDIASFDEYRRLPTLTF